jgi:hypothetical protein
MMPPFLTEKLSHDKHATLRRKRAGAGAGASFA